MRSRQRDRHAPEELHERGSSRSGCLYLTVGVRVGALQESYTPESEAIRGLPVGFDTSGMTYYRVTRLVLCVCGHVAKQKRRTSHPKPNPDDTHNQPTNAFSQMNEGTTSPIRPTQPEPTFPQGPECRESDEVQASSKVRVCESVHACVACRFHSAFMRAAGPPAGSSSRSGRRCTRTRRQQTGSCGPICPRTFHPRCTPSRCTRCPQTRT